MLQALNGNKTAAINKGLHNIREKGMSVFIMTRILAFFFVLTTLFVFPLQSQETTPVPVLPQGNFEKLRITATKYVKQVIDPVRVQLDDGQIVQLVPLDIPDMDGFDAGDNAAAALEFLQGLLSGKAVNLYQTKNSDKGRTNRMGHILAHLELKNDKTWVQGALIASGYARIRPTKDNTEMAGQMLALEKQAQTEKRGLWTDENETVKIYTPEDADGAMNGWAVVEGTVYSLATVSNTLYLNFGQNWRKDFTIGIPSDVRRQLSRAGINPTMDYAGKTLRVHGWVEDYNGPYIELLHPAWIEIVPENTE